MDEQIKPHHWITSMGHMSRRKPPKHCQPVAYYDQQAIDTLRAEVEALRMQLGGEMRIADRWKARAERAEAEAESAWTQANRAAAKVRAWESTMVCHGLPRSIHPIGDWGPGADGYVEIPALTPEKLTSILDRLAAAEAEAVALRKDAERLDWLETQREAYGFEQEHLGNRWVLDGPFNTARAAIDAAKQGSE